MKDYNGFSGAERTAAQRWLNREWSAGRLARPSACCACGQDRGVIDCHAEDYSRPFTAATLAAFPLCYICHLMVHCRFGGGREAWRRYMAMVAEGGRLAPATTRNFAIVKAVLGGQPRARTWHEPPARLVLDEIDAGQHAPMREAPRDLFGPA